MSTSITVPEHFPWVLAGLTLLSTQLFFVNLVYVGRVRKQVFNKEKLEKAFGEEHKKATGTEITAYGYPDTGNGRYSTILSYGDWLRFNYAQRIHYNFLEFFSPYVVLTLIAGLNNPVVAAISVFGTVASRVLFHIGYAVGGAKNPLRVIGAIGSDIGIITSLVVAVCGLCKWCSCV